ncbi:hypothetical protein [Methylobacterium sp. ARG-1]|uniref:DUF6414 family protein n=1 Tax=Methylobacterium sp. ARG-1 TaxID=1692501 RepID=UPI000A7EFE2D|nr:hypothetical protein [Methylobacterium sp. ARG-1]
MPSSEMPQNEESGSEEPYEDQPRDSVYDFIYQDVRRIGSFLAQFDEYGVRQSVKATQSTGRNESTRGAATGSVSIPHVMTGAGTYDSSIGTDARDSAEFTFDPLWSNARRLLDYLTQHNLLHKDIWNTRLGSFIQLEGQLAVIDVSLAKPALKVNYIKNLMRQGAIQHLAGSQAERNKVFDAFSEVVGFLPDTVQAHLVGSNFTAWCTLADNFLSNPSAELALKHGPIVRGDWTLIGILDAFPDPDQEPTPDNPEPQTLSDVVAEHSGTMIGSVAARINSVARSLAGRSQNFFGVTPLVIFREVSATSAAIS